LLAIPDNDVDPETLTRAAHTRLTISPANFLKTQRVGALGHDSLTIADFGIVSH
jgi:hypothetical protein